MSDSAWNDADEDLDTVWPTEWWERTRERQEAWAERNASTLRLLGTIRTVVLVGALVWVVVAAVVVPDLRSGMAAWIGVLWIVLLYVALLRTKTLAWSSTWGLFTSALVWSVVLGLSLRALAQSIGTAGVEAAGPAIALASLGEESLKLVPIAAVALLAPARIHRFALADWLLAGVVCGAAFLAVEETMRRVLFSATDPTADGLPFTFTTFGLLGSTPGLSGSATFPGHHVATGLVATSVGLGVLLVRRSRREGGPWARVLLVLGVLVPLATWWSAVVRHAGLNADALRVPLPWPMRAWEAVLPDGWGSTLWVLGAIVLVMLVDARRLARWADASFEAEPEPRWLVDAEQRIFAAEARAADAGPWPRRLAGGLAALAHAAVRLAHVVLRDGKQVLQAHSSRMGTNRWAAGRAARTLGIMQRDMRQIAYHLDGGEVPRTRTRWIAGGTLVLLLLTGWVVAPLVARSLGADVISAQTGWLAGMLAQLGEWWSALAVWEKVTAGVAALSMTALSTVAVDSTTLRASVQGPAPRFTTTTPAGALLELGQAGLTLVAGSSAVDPSGLQARAAEYRADPVAWRGAQAQLLSRSHPGA